MQLQKLHLSKKSNSDNFQFSTFNSPLKSFVLKPDRLILFAIAKKVCKIALAAAAASLKN
jgi:hypothetical protein